MSVKVYDLDKAIAEAERFLRTARDLRAEGRVTSWNGSLPDYESGKLTAAVKRASMDLTRALPPLRRRQN